LIGNFKNPGAKWERTSTPVNDHDFRSVVDRGEKLGHSGGVERTSEWVTLRPAAGQKNGPGTASSLYFDTFFAASASAAC
jgi:hypothetical protein